MSRRDIALATLVLSLAALVYVGINLYNHTQAYDVTAPQAFGTLSIQAIQGAFPDGIFPVRTATVASTKANLLATSTMPAPVRSTRSVTDDA